MMTQPDSPLYPVSHQAQAISSLFALSLVIGAVILALVTGLVIYVSFRYRNRGVDGEPKQDFGRRKLEIAWTIAPAVLLGILFFLTVRTMQISDPAVHTNDQPDIVVIAHQWWWELRYPESGVITANEIHLPAGRRMLVRLESADVIHSFWVPQLGRKMDAIPGHPNFFWLQADKPGGYRGTCSEYCGAQHAHMLILVIVQSRQAFTAWTKQQLENTIPANHTVADGGRQLFNSLTCVNCHVTKDIGPDLTHIASRETIGAGVLKNTPSNLSLWLQNPQAVKPGCHMPDMKLTDSQIQQVVAYLENSK